MAEKSRISQQQIARDLGVSQALVSIVLNGRRSGVSEASFRKIWAHAKRVGYQPKGMSSAKRPSESESPAVGFILREGLKLYNQSPFFGQVQHGLHEFLAQQGVPLIFLGTERFLEAAELQSFCQQRENLRGLVVFGEVSRTFLQALKQLQSKLVVVSAQFPGLCHSVTYNEEQAANLLVEHLAELGHRSFAWIGGPDHMQRPLRRREAALGALRLRGLSADPDCLIETEGSGRTDGWRAAETLVERAKRKSLPTAWICFNGMTARGASDYLLQNGIRIPEDVSVVTFDQTRNSAEERPRLTAASADPETVGRVAGEILVRATGATTETLSDTVLPSYLVVRASSGPASEFGQAELAGSTG